jgi:hypothetical protein
MYPDEEAQKSWDRLKGLKSAIGDVTIKQSTFDQFQEGKRFDKFDFVVTYGIGDE